MGRGDKRKRLEEGAPHAHRVADPFAFRVGLAVGHLRRGLQPRERLSSSLEKPSAHERRPAAPTAPEWSRHPGYDRSRLDNNCRNKDGAQKIGGARTYPRLPGARLAASIASSSLLSVSATKSPASPADFDSAPRGTSLRNTFETQNLNVA